MDRYDVILIVFSLCAFVISVCKITAGFTKAISRLETTVEQFGNALCELKQTIVTLREDNKKTHSEIFSRIEMLDSRLVRLEVQGGIV